MIYLRIRHSINPNKLLYVNSLLYILMYIIYYMVYNINTIYVTAYNTYIVQNIKLYELFNAI